MRRSFTFAVATITPLLFCAPAHGQSAPEPRRQGNPQDVQQMMDATMGAMVPIMVRMTEGMLEAQLKVAERPETAARIAAFKKNLFEALKNSGFSAEQALQIVIATSIPAASPGTK
jgi:hypothetical protein